MNPHGIYHTHLKRARLPVPPPSHIRREIPQNVFYHTGRGKSIPDDVLLNGFFFAAFFTGKQCDLL